MPRSEQKRADFGTGSGAAEAITLKNLSGLQFAGRSAQRPLQLMEICGTHTMAIAQAGLRQLLPPTVKLISGPGCPVCVTPAGALDEVFRIAALPGVILATYGDLLRVPGSLSAQAQANAGTRVTLALCKARGADVRVVYSAMDCLAMAAQNPQKTVVFLGVGFETTAPGTAATVLAAQKNDLHNFALLCLLKRTEPALRAILADETCRVDGLLCPGHVATILGAEAFRFLPQEYHLPAVVSGFESGDVVRSVCMLCAQAAAGQAILQNEYARAVRPQGNLAARTVMNQVFVPVDDVWRGLGEIPLSGFALRPEFAAFDAARRFGFAAQNRESTDETGGCRCGEVLRGRLEPAQCPLFGRACTPTQPVGPCMVSREGACAAAYQYRMV